MCMPPDGQEERSLNLFEQDEASGIDWWNVLTEDDRRFWLAAALTATPAEAWKYFKRCGCGGADVRAT